MVLILHSITEIIEKSVRAGGPVNLPTGERVMPAEAGWTDGTHFLSPPPPHPEVPNGKIAVGSELVVNSGTLEWSYALADEPEPEPAVTVLYPADLWRRATDAEAEAIESAMDAQPVRLRRIFTSAQEYRSDDELWPLLVQVAETLFGAERASVLLAAS